MLWEPHILQNGKCLWNILKLAIAICHGSSCLSIVISFVKLWVSMVVGVLGQVHCGFAELVPKNSDEMKKVP
jgi:large-conductance mechanosensitive channel